MRSFHRLRLNATIAQIIVLYNLTLHSLQFRNLPFNGIKKFISLPEQQATHRQQRIVVCRAAPREAPVSAAAAAQAPAQVESYIVVVRQYALSAHRVHIHHPDETKSQACICVVLCDKHRIHAAMSANLFHIFALICTGAVCACVSIVSYENIMRELMTARMHS